MCSYDGSSFIILFNALVVDGDIGFVVIGDSRSVALITRPGRLADCVPSCSRPMYRVVFDYHGIVGFVFVIPVLLGSFAAPFRRCRQQLLLLFPFFVYKLVYHCF